MVIYELLWRRYAAKAGPRLPMTSEPLTFPTEG
jgi:hypothetical protein